MRIAGGRSRVDADTVSTVAEASAPAPSPWSRSATTMVRPGAWTCAPALDAAMAPIDSASMPGPTPAAVLRAAQLLTERRLTLTRKGSDADATATEIRRRVESHPRN